MDAGMFLRGLAIGFAVAAPVGAIGVLCIRRTLAHGRAAGFVSGLGAATADAAYGAIAAFGLASLSGLLVDHEQPIRLVGGLFLCWLGLRTLRAAPAAMAGAEAAPRLASAYASTLALTLTNPSTILSFAAIFAGAGLVGGRSGSAALMVLGVFLGSAAWWLLLSGGVGLLRGALTPARLRWVNRVSGCAILAFGVVALVG
jgi:threonine/homoserine/homoserine lactone efflux protein